MTDFTITSIERAGYLADNTNTKISFWIRSEDGSRWVQRELDKTHFDESYYGMVSNYTDRESISNDETSSLEYWCFAPDYIEAALKMGAELEALGLELGLEYPESYLVKNYKKLASDS